MSLFVNINIGIVKSGRESAPFSDDVELFFMRQRIVYPCGTQTHDMSMTHTECFTTKLRKCDTFLVMNWYTGSADVEVLIVRVNTKYTKCVGATEHILNQRVIGF